MPNWCNNQMTITHDNPEMMLPIIAAWNSGEFFQTLVPCPQELRNTVAGFRPDPGHEEQQKNNIKKYGHANWYDWQVQNWGTKWDVGFEEDHGNRGELHNGSMTVGFDSAWSPPIAAYQELVDRGYRITAYYFEPGMAFWGSFIDGSEDYYCGGDYVPKDIDEAMNVTETLAQYAEEV